MKRSIALTLAVLVFSLFSTPLSAVTVPIELFTNNGIYHSSFEVDLFVEVTFDSSTVDFEFHNDSTVTSSIARIYFDDSSLLEDMEIINGAGTIFTEDSSPANLPAGHELFPIFEADFSAGAVAPPPHNGIDAGESLLISFNLADGVTGADVITAINNGSLRIGVHLIALPDGSSEAGVNVPEPASVLILGLGVILLVKQPKRS